jgi:hypothetical protein
MTQMLEALQPGTYYPTSCPQCQDMSFSVGNFKLNAGLLNGYAPLLDGDGRPNNSVGEMATSEGESAV